MYYQEKANLYCYTDTTYNLVFKIILQNTLPNQYLQLLTINNVLLGIVSASFLVFLTIFIAKFVILSYKKKYIDYSTTNQQLGPITKRIIP